MSEKLLNIIEKFLTYKISTHDFVDKYQKLWKIERDSHILQKDNALLSECLSSVFCAVDIYEPENTREKYEFDEAALKEEVARLVDKLSTQES
ncbi:hypothetical protein MNBD_GAMMA10-84 [hydrothermal vent metagenome]|uniref:Colicin D immunity protein domain-containing protein n=1 Tax=hydrothermal vent metagenome TaxID=652676 RepID=A0A3B0YIL8_9ZZZZ